MMNFDSMLNDIQATIATIMIGEVAHKFFHRKDYEDDRILDICHYMIAEMKKEVIDISCIFRALDEINYITTFRKGVKLN